MRFTGLWLLFAVSSPALADAVEFDPSRYSERVTRCDRLAAHPLDPHRVASGVGRSEMRLEQAQRACERAVSEDPDNPRLHYQLARVYGYGGQGERAMPHREVAVAADYPQALFVVGYLHLYGLNQAPRDVCRGGALIHRSARAGRLAGQIAFARYVTEGCFDECDLPRDADEIDGFLAAAALAVDGDYYRGMLVEMLRARVDATLR